MSMQYKTGADSSIGKNIVDVYYYRKALIDVRRQMFFGQLADTTTMPKNFGKKIQVYNYIPLLDDRNINDQGIDATGVSIANEVTIAMTSPEGATTYAVGTGVDAASALTNSQGRAVDYFKMWGLFNTDYATTKTALEALGWVITENPAVNAFGNLYGSSRDIGYITSKLPVLDENGGRVNRVGFTRRIIEGSLEKYGFFTEYTKDSLDFDSDAELYSHITTEALQGANEVVEDLLQKDLLNSAGIVLYGGNATSVSTITGENGSTASTLTYDMLNKIDTELNNNRCKKNTTIITGSRLTDTKVVDAARYIYIGSELKTTIKKMVDYHNERAFIPVQHYASAGTIANGEIGSIDSFRIIEVPEMMYWAGAGASVSTNGGYRETSGKYDVYPALVVGSQSFTTIGFQTDGKEVKFQIINVAPGKEAADYNNPFGEKGFYSIKWYYGTLILRPEWIAIAKVVAEI